MNRYSAATAAAVWMLWVAGMFLGDKWGLFREVGYMSATMAFGSFIAGSTSEGGGAVAFPVMTLGFHIAPAVARDFSLMIQAVGMTAAAVAIFTSRIPVAMGALPPAALGGALGVIVGLERIAPVFPTDFAKMGFTALWLSFAGALWLMNRDRSRAIEADLPQTSACASALLGLVGVLGGIVTSITGSGLDILTFSILVLLFRVCERVATPTSVVLMASNAIVGSVWKASLSEGLAPQAWNFWWVCVPVVVIGAPLGAHFIRNRSRTFITRLLIASILTQFVASLLIVPQAPGLVGFYGAVFCTGLVGFWALSRAGSDTARIQDGVFTAAVEATPAPRAPGMPTAT